MDIRVPNITDIPHEILTEIILYLNLKERVPLGNSCKKFHTLVFEDTKLLRDLDFSKEVDVTSGSDIYRYFNDENRNKHILRVNLKNVHCLKPEVMINYISKAINLVDINIHGITIRDRQVLEDLLRPLPHLKRFSFNWPTTGMLLNDNPCCKDLQERFVRLTYLSVRLGYIRYFSEFYRVLQSCQELKELCLTVMNIGVADPPTILTIDLKNLEVVSFYGYYAREISEHLVSILPHPEEWTHFHPVNPLLNTDGFHLERNVEVCEELLGSKSIKRVSHDYPNFTSKLGGFVDSTCLLNEVMKINLRNLPEKLSCFLPPNKKDAEHLLLPSEFEGSKLWSLKIEEAKRLLKDSRYQITYLGIFHDIKQECNTHIVALVFPNLNELVLSNITTRRQITDTASSDDSNQLLDPDSSFSRLVASTPHVRHLTVIPNESRSENDEIWDLAALHLISGWKNLTTLCLWNIPLLNGKFLIEIGKQCKQLENLELFNLGTCYKCCYKKELLQMLRHCANLRVFALRQDNINQFSKMLYLLANNPQLRSVYIISNYNRTTRLDLRPCTIHLLQCCSKLTTFMCLIDAQSSRADTRKLASTLQRLKSELNRPNFQFRVDWSSHGGHVRPASPEPFCIWLDD